MPKYSIKMRLEKGFVPKTRANPSSSKTFYRALVLEVAAVQWMCHGLSNHLKQRGGGQRKTKTMSKKFTTSPTLATRLEYIYSRLCTSS